MDAIKWIALVAAAALVAVFALSGKRPVGETGKGAEDSDDPDEVVEKQAGETEPDEETENDFDGGDFDEDEFDMEEAELLAETAVVAAKNIEQRAPGLYADPRDQLAFVVDFKIYKGKKKTATKSVEVPEDIYDGIELGESGELITQNGRFVDFGDRYAEEIVPEESGKKLAAKAAKPKQTVQQGDKGKASGAGRAAPKTKTQSAAKTATGKTKSGAAKTKAAIKPKISGAAQKPAAKKAAGGKTAKK